MTMFISFLKIIGMIYLTLLFISLIRLAVNIAGEVINDSESTVSKKTFPEIFYLLIVIPTLPFTYMSEWIYDIKNIIRNTSEKIRSKDPFYYFWGFPGCVPSDEMNGKSKKAFEKMSLPEFMSAFSKSGVYEAPLEWFTENSPYADMVNDLIEKKSKISENKKNMCLRLMMRNNGLRSVEICKPDNFRVIVPHKDSYVYEDPNTGCKYYIITQASKA